MKILLINPPYQTLTSNWGVGHQIPLGLLMVGGPLLDAGHCVRLLDAECQHLTLAGIVQFVRRFAPDLVLTGHAGSTPAHPVCMNLLRAIKSQLPHVYTAYGGVYPTYHAAEILAQEECVDLIVRGEGEATTTQLVEALAVDQGRSPFSGCKHLTDVAGLAFRAGREITFTPDRLPVHDLDAYRVGWELVPDWSRYQCFGLGTAAIVQFSRGCPHHCTYCGQHGFWVRWRHRDPVRLVEEIAWLHRVHGVRFITLADENPTTLQPQWQRFLAELANRRLPVSFFATIRATDIVRDADLLGLYRRAGILYVLMGIESADGDVLKRIHKGSTPQHDREACRLLRRHGIFSILGYITGFENETWTSLRADRGRLVHYEADWLNAMFVTPHSWTKFGQESAPRPVVEPDQQKWDYRHQVLGQRHLEPWQLFLWVKWVELWFHLRPRRLLAIFHTRDRFRLQQSLWVYFHIGLVWLGEILEFLREGGRRRHKHRRIPPSDCRTRRQKSKRNLQTSSSR
jgi:anaerobic magnesium-protoporphyrin IX monomethyl ester cyclase